MLQVFAEKIFTEPDLKNKIKQTDTAHIYVKALDTILMAMKGYRIFDRFGFDAPQKSKAKFTPAKLLSLYGEFEYDSKSTYWVNPYTGELLTDCIYLLTYKPY